MGRIIAIGIQNYNDLIEHDYFYIDKTKFIPEWWESGDAVTLIARPRRFGKTLTMSMVEQFFSIRYAGREDLFEGKYVWQNQSYCELQGTYPVISLSFANVKETTYAGARKKLCQMLAELYAEHTFLLESTALEYADRDYFKRVSYDMDDADAGLALHNLSKYLYRYYGKKTIILLDEYDTPMQEAYLNGYWKELTDFTRNLFHSTFKTNAYLERAVMTGITRISKESVFSDLNNLKIVTTTSAEYADIFGFTEAEVIAAMKECNRTQMQEVKEWYDGFVFGEKEDIYNPWSILNYLDTGKFMTYWANTSSNGLINRLIREGSPEIKIVMEDLLNGKTLRTRIEEQIVYDQLDGNEQAIWSFLLASGYLKAESCKMDHRSGRPEYELSLTNMEVRLMFQDMIRYWFSDYTPAYNNFVKALLLGDKKAMNNYMNRVALQTFSYFDTGKRPSEAEPERFYHGFVLGLLVDLGDRYIVSSNRESGFGRYDVMLEPLQKGNDAYILEFKVHDPGEEQTLQDTVDAALLQIEEQQYEVGLLAKGIAKKQIHKYGFAFEGKKVLIG